ncbi:MAG TPA: hypothetical protein VIL45_07065 [Thermoplasmata archaeon]
MNYPPRDIKSKIPWSFIVDNPSRTTIAGFLRSLPRHERKPARDYLIYIGTYPIRGYDVVDRPGRLPDGWR